ncbi:MAG TPA: hypothetical protein VNW47_14905 [Terriglobales bacterium]|nr:hypothetical protein [Terriglobales bacterium]
MFSRMMDAMFGCWHSRYSFPMTARAGSRRNKPGARLGTYVVCLDCGKEFDYDWKEMRVLDGSSKSESRSLVIKEAA